MTLGTPQDVTLQELRIETFFPADEESADLEPGCGRVQPLMKASSSALM
jgi:hypothetical protein